MIVSGLMSSPAASTTSTSQKNDALADDFMKYMDETPAQRFRDAWLKSHHLSEQQLAAMPPDQRQAIEKEMAEDMKEKMQEQAGKKQTAIGASLF
jgi:hypothetical protein